MTHRLSVSLPDDLYESVALIASGSNISAASVVRTILSDTVPKLRSVLTYLGTVTPAQAPGVVADLDAWSEDFRRVMQDAPESLGDFRTILDPPPAGGDE